MKDLREIHIELLQRCKIIGEKATDPNLKQFMAIQRSVMGLSIRSAMKILDLTIRIEKVETELFNINARLTVIEKK